VIGYNNEHHHSGIRYVTPNERHEGLDVEILEKREQVYAAAKKKRPERWSQQTRNWSFIKSVELNPEIKALAA